MFARAIRALQIFDECGLVKQKSISLSAACYKVIAESGPLLAESRLLATQPIGLESLGVAHLRDPVMSHAELLHLVEAYERAEIEFGTRGGLAVWVEVVDAEPELASEILQLFATDDAAARWVAGSSDETGCSPARHIAEGRAAHVLSIVRSAAHGFCA